MRAVIILVYLVLLLYRGYARTDITIPDKPICIAQAVKQGGPDRSTAALIAIEVKEDDDDDFTKKFKLFHAPSKRSHTIVVSHLTRSSDNRLPVYHPVPYRTILLSRLRI